MIFFTGVNLTGPSGADGSSARSIQRVRRIAHAQSRVPLLAEMQRGLAEGALGFLSRIGEKIEERLAASHGRHGIWCGLIGAPLMDVVTNVLAIPVDARDPVGIPRSLI